MAWAMACLMLMTLVSGASGAEDDAQDGRDLRRYVDSAWVDVQEPVRGTLLVPYYPFAGCGTDRFVFGQDRFAYRDNQTASCGEARLVVDIPDNASEIKVRFHATRDFERGAGVDLVRLDAEQAFRVYNGSDPQGPPVHEVVYQDPSNASDPTGSVYTWTWPTAGLADTVTLGWWFREGDPKDDDRPTYTGRMFVANVSAATVVFPDLHLALPQTGQVGQVSVDDDVLTTRIDIDLDIEEAWVSGGRDAALTLRLFDALALQAVTGPGGQVLDPQTIVVRDDGSGRSVRVPGDLVALHGPGTYSFRFLEQSAFVPASAEGASASGLPFLLLGAVPLVLAGFAMRSTIRARRLFAVDAAEPQGALERAGWAVVGLYAAGFVILGVTGRHTELVGWPPSGVASFGFVSFLAATTAAALVWRAAEKRILAVFSQRWNMSRKDVMRLESRTQEMETLLYGVGHDLKTPIIALEWLTKELETDMGDADPEALRETLHRIRSSIGGMERLVASLLDAAELDRHVPMPKEVDVQETLDNVLEELAPLARRHKSRIGIELGRVPRVVSDPVAFERTLMNLVKNAIEHGRPKRGQVQVIGDTFDGPDGRPWIEIHIDDDGRGVPHAERTSVFGFFHQGSHGSKKGHGIGLAMVKRFVTRNGGQVYVSDSPLGGARFSVLLPRDGPAPPLGTSAEPAPGAESPPGNILEKARRQLGRVTDGPADGPTTEG